ncbi:MAG TPA: DUF3618 domain-containing protein [Stellaceae bacterium]|jgi:hypothetical protein|nr:DUF3618 domain-containing protein [Stellaceae bacterium]
MTASPGRPMDEIEIEIARTRARLATTADMLAAELAPPRLVEKGVDMLNGFLGRSGAIGFGGGVRADPVALALIGLGAAWLVAENIGLLDGLIPEPRDETATSGEPIVALPADRPEAPHDTGDGWLHQAASATQGVLRSVYDRGGAAIGQAGGFIAHPANAGERVREAGGRVVESVERSPLLLGLVGIAAGAAIAMLLPTSRRERELATQARDDLWDKAEELGHRAANSVREMAEGPLRASTDR